jgi:CubicO group peptidase (beta-lactamase class C family)
MRLHYLLTAATMSLAVFASACSQSTTVERAAIASEPVSAFDLAGLEAFDAALDERTQRGVRSGYAALLIRNGQTHVSTAGLRDIEGDTPIGINTQMRIASMSKPITAVALMMLVEDGILSLDDPVAHYLPEFAGTGIATSLEADGDGAFATVPQETELTVRHLLTHTSGVGYLFDGDTALGRYYFETSLYQGPGNLEQKIGQLAMMPLYFQPGDRWFYSYSSDILGRVIEVAAGMPFETFLQTRLFDPLNMNSTGFYLEGEELNQLAVLYVHGEDGHLYPVYSDDRPEPRQQWASGGGGLVSTAADYARFASMLAASGEFEGVRYLEAETLADMIQPQVPQDKLPSNMSGFGYGYGVGIVLPPAEGERARGIPGDYGWGGFFDTDFFISPSTGLVAVMMTQEQPNEHMPEGRTASWWRAAAYATLPAE